jgi:glycosyltransferase involved in cell wall biosynthesis
MRIGMMADLYKPHISGVTNSIELSKRWLEQQGHEVYIFTFGDDDVVDDEKNVIRTSGVAVVDTGFYFNLRYDKQARHLLYSMDICHIHHPFISGSLAMRYCVPRNIPIVFTNHTRYDLMTQAYLPILPESIGDAALKAYLAPFYRACDLVIVPTPRIKHVLEEHFGLTAPVDIIPNGVDLAAYRKSIQPVDRGLFGISKDDIIVIYVGRLSPEKNISFLLRAFYGVAMTYKNVHLLLVGEGPERDNLEAQVRQLEIGNKVHFTGLVEYHNIPTYLAASDIFVTPSYAETFGLSTVEGMAAGLPALGIDAPGSGDIIEDGFSGLVSSDDLAVFTAKLVLLSTNHELRRTMGKNAAKASEKYDINNTGGITLRHYQRLIQATQKRKRGPRYRFTRFLDRFK